MNQQATAVQTFPFPIKRIDKDYPSLTERYFTPKFFIPKSNQETNCANQTADQCVLTHSNK